MTSKLLVIFTACVFLSVHAGSDFPRRENAESYITKEAAKELRNKLSHIKSDGKAEEQQDDYDEILKEIIHTIQQQGSREQQQQHQPSVFYEKKYFDYLPNEISDSDDVTSEDLEYELVRKPTEYISVEDEQQQQHMVNNDAITAKDDDDDGSSRRKVKRDVMQQGDANKSRNKRQNFVYVPLRHINPFPNVHFYYPSHDPFFSDIFKSSASETRNPSYAVPPLPQQPAFGVNPWVPQNNPNIRLHAPGNYYLPPATQPPRTYLPAQSDQQLTSGAFGERFGGFGEEEDRPVWEVRPLRPVDNRPIYNNNLNGGGGSASQNNYPTTQRPAPAPQPTINMNKVRPETNSIDEDIEIEYAPELQEDVTSTTRAPLVFPTRKQNQQSRQKKQDTTTQQRQQQQPRGENKSSDNLNSLYSQQVSGSNPQQPKRALPACVQAIVNCCSKYDESVKTSCFEAHQCKGFFFGQNPCSNSIKQAAFKEVEKYTK